ncbi:GLABROUS1 enhancer-binding protein family [Arabidopsis suecica]|uniref:GLABROUS1 enhancer-binding protein family n=1 Tax=Arabidopsis suecica TaxID=45249 RepID=A0A8T2G0F4_ARASU|nr:GLABROUS1 enhancer-binding protein family [Arabidopsis suecica]
MKGITKKLLVSRSLKRLTAKKNRRKIHRETNKRLKPEEDPSMVKRRQDSDSDSLEKEVSVVVTKTSDDEMVSTDTKKNYFQRIWSDDDEIVLLQGMVDFENDKGKSPYDDMTGFIDTVKNFISFQANQHQFTTKIRRLKDKFLKKWNNGVDENSLVNAHDRKCFQLSKVIWEPTTKVEEVGDWFVNSYLVGSIASLGVSEDVMKQSWSMVPIETKKELEEKFKLLKDEESENLRLKTSFLQKVNTMIIEATN